jgi:site-specific recombinase XerD
VAATTNHDIYNYPRRLEKHKEAIAAMKNGLLTLNFLDHLLVQGLFLARVSKYAAHLRTLLRIIDFQPENASKQQIESAVAWIQSRGYAEWTKHDLKLILRKLIQFAKTGNCNKNTPLPEEVAWIPLNVRQHETVTAEDLLTIEDVLNIVKNARNLRDQAMLSTLFEGALRITELLTMRVGSVEFRDNYCLLSVNGKTGFRRVIVVLASGVLRDWLNQHPYRNDPNAPLWVSLSTNGDKRAFHYASFRELVKNTAKKAGIKKRVWGYLFRHSQLTLLAKKLTEPQLKGVAGWTQSSKMAARYVHFSGRDNEYAILTIHGMSGADEQKENGIMMLVTCPRCRAKNSPATIRCIRCGLILDQKTAIELQSKEEKKLDDALSRLESLEKLVLSVLAPKAPS